MRLKPIYILCLLLAGLSVKGQLIVNNALSPTQLVQGVLLGNGVTASNIIYNGDALSIGKFNAVNTNLGLDSGVVMSTGTVSQIPGPAGNFTSTAFMSAWTDPDLAAILAASSGAADNDITRLEFDFIPMGDTVKFDYVFASEEYPVFVCSFNDVFGFFLSGPGISGPYTNNAQNIAIIPGTSTPVSIYNINGGVNNIPNDPSCPAVNPQYYVNNTPGTTISFNGLTTVMTAVSPVICGQVYHVKMVICDAGDWSYDSGIFLAANSFASEGVQLSTSVDMGGNDSTLYEGCGTGSIALVRGGDITVGDTIHFTISGSPNNNDYTPFADSVVYQPGQDTAYIYINATQDNLVEGLDSIVITTLAGPCSSIPSSITLYIADVPPIYTTAGIDTTITCAGDPAMLYGSAVGGVPGYFYEWNQGLGPGRVKWVNPLQTTTYILTVYDTCMQVVDYDTMTVFVPVYQPLQAIGCPDRSIVCPNQEVTLWANGVGGLPPYTFTWMNPSAAGNTLVVSPPNDQLFVIRVTDACNIMFDFDTILVNLLDFDSLRVELPERLEICRGDSIFVEAKIFGGVENYRLNWLHNGSSNYGQWLGPSNHDRYTVAVIDSCQNAHTATVEILIHEPVADFTSTEYHDGNYQLVFQDASINPVELTWEMPGGVTLHDPSFLWQFPDSGYYPVTLIMKDETGCYDTVAKNVYVNPEMFIYFPNAFTPNGDGYNDVLRVASHGEYSIDLQIYDRWGNIIWRQENTNNPEWNGNDIHGQIIPQGAYVYTLTARGLNGKSIKQKGSITLLR